MKYFIVFFSLFYRCLVYCKRRASLISAISQGIVLGAGTRVVGDVSFGSEPYLISIGENCLITDGVKFVTHDGGVQVPFIKGGAFMHEIYGRKVLAGRISLGDNIFIGNGVIALLGTTIGDNVLVGAGSVLKGNYPSNCVVAGVPAKVICSIEDYYKRNHLKIIDVDSEDLAVRKAILLKQMAE